MSTLSVVVQGRSVEIVPINIQATRLTPSSDFYILDSGEDISGNVNCDPIGMSCSVDRDTLIVPPSLENLEGFISEIELICTNHYKYGVA